MSGGETALVWFRDDLRLADNPALDEAARHGPLLCLYVFDDVPARRALGGAAAWWLSQSLKALARKLEVCGSALTVMRGDPAEIVPLVAERIGAGLVTWNRRYEAQAIALDRDLKVALGENGIAVRTFNATLLNEPWQVTTRTGDPMKVFTPYWRAARARGEPPAPLPAPTSLTAAELPDALHERRIAIDALGLEPSRPDWAGGLRDAWEPGETGATNRLIDFLESELDGYAEDRDRPDRPATSRLSPHLRFGEVSPRQIWHVLRGRRETGAAVGSAADAEKFLSELGWREFSYHLLFHNPDLATQNYNRRFDAFPWRRDEAALRAWQAGRTGYPIIDAGLRQLWQTGWMHNRVRMIVASFLIKHLLIDWREGERWFWDTLVDADPANNPASWQWVAGSGADASPYYRIFNPVTQGEKFDPRGDYVRQFVPELAGLDSADIHRPWQAPPSALATAGIVLGQDYPEPIIDLAAGRERALAALKTLGQA